MSNKNERYHLTFSIYSALSLTLLTIILLLIIWYAIDIFLLAFAGILFAIFLKTLANELKTRCNLSSNVSMTIVLGIFFLLFLLLLGLITPVITDQLKNLWEELPKAWNQLRQMSSKLFFYYEIRLEKFLPQELNIFNQAGNLFSTTFGFFGSLLVFLFFGIFFAYDPGPYRKGVLQFFPENKRDEGERVLTRVTQTLRWWLIGQIFAMVLVGILTTISLGILGVQMALTLGFLAGLFTFIPNLGPILSAILAMLIAFIQKPILALYVLILYIVIQTVESYLITPLIQKKTISQPPALIIFAQFLMAVLVGILGLALATPLLAVVSVLFQEFKWIGKS